MFIYEWVGQLEELELTEIGDLLWEAGAQGLEQRGDKIRAYFAAPIELPESLCGTWHQEAEQDWQAEFKKTIQPIRAGKITVVAPWQADQADEPKLIIEPGMAFGTGHHATTRMAIEALCELQATDQLVGKRVIDVGTGSGVLAMAARKLNTAYALGLDIDPITIPIARENAILNELYEDIQFEVGTLGDYPASDYDVLVANLYAELHEVLVGDYLESVCEGAPLILTGILSGKAAQVVAALQAHHLENIQTREDGEWVLITANAPCAK